MDRISAERREQPRGRHRVGRVILDNPAILGIDHLRGQEDLLNVADTAGAHALLFGFGEDRHQQAGHDDQGHPDR